MINDLEKIMGEFKSRIMEITTNESNASIFEEQYFNIINKYLEKIDFLLNDYGLSCDGRAIEYFQQELNGQNRKYTAKVIDETIEFLIQAIGISTDWEFEANSDILKNDSLTSEEKLELVNNNSKYKFKKFDEAQEASSKINFKFKEMLEEYICLELYNSLRMYVIEIKISGLYFDSSYEMIYQELDDRFFEIKDIFLKITSELIEDYDYILKDFDKQLFDKCVQENENYFKEYLEMIKQELLPKEEKDESKDSEEKNDNPFLLSDEYKKKIVEVGKNQNKSSDLETKRKDDSSLDISDIDINHLFD